MNVITVATPLGVVSFTERQVSMLRSGLGLPAPVQQPTDGIPDFTDDEVLQMIEDGGNASRVLQNRRYH